MGDVKYSFVLGLVVGWTNPDGWLLFIWLSFILATLWSVWKFFRRKIQFGSHLAFAPFLTVGVIASCLPIVF
jgi:prepilin signal peptidase PulO-like enzyme (type II secretory pathway)